MEFQKFEIKKNVNLYYVPTLKFKTNSISIYIERPLLKDECTKNALIASMLRRSSPKFPTSKELAVHLEELYNAMFSTVVQKIAERQIISIRLQYINEKFIDDDINLSDSILDLINDAVLCQKSFNKEYLKQEKENLKQLILSDINDKRLYASKKCTEIMCKDEPYGISKNGYIEDIDKIDSDSLFNHYKNVILKSPVEIFVNGDADIMALKNKFERMFNNIEVTETLAPPADVKKEVDEIKTVTEEQPVAQGKLSMGFRTNVFMTDSNYPALMIYNAVLGCGIYSKLFNNVREKLSLCYYASSSIDHLKGIMKINSGIEVKNFKKAYDEILVQIKDIEEGKISDMEMSAAILGTVNSLKSLTDSSFLLNDYYMGKIISGKIIGIYELVDALKNITKEQVIAVSKKIHLDTVFFLKGCEK